MPTLLKMVPNPYYVKGYGLDPELITHMRAYIVARAKALGPIPEFGHEQPLRDFEATHTEPGKAFRDHILQKHALPT